jgi:hypothetical protein
VVLDANGTSSYIEFEANTERKWFIPPSAASLSELIFDIQPIDTQWTAHIMAYNHLDGHDTGRLSLSGGGAISSTRGGRIDLYGADRGGAGLGGDVAVLTADSGDLTLSSANSGRTFVQTGSSGGIDFRTGGTDRQWFIEPAGASESELRFEITPIDTQWTANIMAYDHGDGHDTGRLSLTGGGEISSNRGGRIDLYGADRGAPGAGGDVILISADAGDILLNSGAGGNVIIDDSAGTTWSAFGSVGSGTACTVTNGDYVTIKLNNIVRRIVLCD